MLNDNIHLVSSTGYEARLSQAVVDMNKGNVVSDTPVWVKLLDGDLNAKRLEIDRQGRRAALHRCDDGAAVGQARTPRRLSHEAAGRGCRFWRRLG